MADRNCTDYATKMTTGKDDDGNPICKGLDDFNYSVDPNESDDYKCGGEWQAGQRCKAQCCEVNIEYCKQNCAGDTDPDKCITDCTKQRNCHSELTCDDYTHDVKPSDDQKCGGEEKGGSNCHKQCCETQAEWCGCGHNSRDCMKDRGCDNSLAAHDVEFTVSNSGLPGRKALVPEQVQENRRVLLLYRRLRRPRLVDKPGHGVLRGQRMQGQAGGQRSSVLLPRNRHVLARMLQRHRLPYRRKWRSCVLLRLGKVPFP